MSKFEMIPLYNTQAVMNAWPKIQEGLEKVIENAANDHDKTTLLNELLGGQKLLWLGFVDGKYVAFSVTYFHVTGTQPQKKILQIDSTYKDPKADSDITEQFINRLTQYAREQGASQIDIWSTRKGFERYIKKHDFLPSYTKYSKEIK